MSEQEKVSHPAVLTGNPGEGEVAVTLGHGQVQYFLQDVGAAGHLNAVEVVRLLATSATKMALRWPTSPCEVSSFMDQLQGWVTSASGSAFDSGAYDMKHFLRLTLLLLQELRPGIVDGLKLGEVLRWVPEADDEVCEHFSNHTMEQVAFELGVNGLMATYWVRKMKSLIPAQLEILWSACDRAILNVVDDFLISKHDDPTGGHESGLFPPGLRAIARAVVSKSAVDIS